MRTDLFCKPITGEFIMRRILRWSGFIALTFSGFVQAASPLGVDELKQQVAETERAFAKTMADRDHAAFATFIAEDAVFFAGKRPLRGREEIVKAWKPFYDEAPAPFSWAPETVEVLPSGDLALSSGPVKDPNGREMATFTSIWRLDSSGKWQVVFDKGNNACNCDKP
jgi:uncharacterized protein (TIGR02246 family)